MRLWTLHPRYLDPQGLVALWREGLLARKVLEGKTRGYKHHPQLERFKACANPVAAVDAYLHAVCDEADRRGYSFAREKLGARRAHVRVRVRAGQIEFEWTHLLAKLRKRSPAQLAQVRSVARRELHPLFTRARGDGPEPWERP